MTKWSYHNDKSDTILITIFRAHFVLAIIINHHTQNLQTYIMRIDYESPLRMHIDSDILTPSSEPINQFARQLITLLDTSDLVMTPTY